METYRPHAGRTILASLYRVDNLSRINGYRAEHAEGEPSTLRRHRSPRAGNQLIWHVVGPDPDLAPWRAALADWVGITDTPLATKQAAADRLGISHQAVGQRIGRTTAAGQQIPLTTAQRRALTTLTSAEPGQRRTQRRIASLFGLTVTTRPAVYRVPRPR